MMGSRKESFALNEAMDSSSPCLGMPPPLIMNHNSPNENICDVGDSIGQIQAPVGYASRKNKYTVAYQNGIDRMNVPEILYSRQIIGNSWSRNFSNRRQLQIVGSTNDLSSKIAWNPNRIQNMVLSIGPGTPASVCWRDSDAEAEGDDDDEDDDDDDDEDEDEDDRLSIVSGTAEDSGDAGEIRADWSSAGSDAMFSSASQTSHRNCSGNLGNVREETHNAFPSCSSYNEEDNSQQAEDRNRVSEVTQEVDNESTFGNDVDKEVTNNPHPYMDQNATSDSQDHIILPVSATSGSETDEADHVSQERSAHAVVFRSLRRHIEAVTREVSASGAETGVGFFRMEDDVDEDNINDDDQDDDDSDAPLFQIQTIMASRIRSSRGSLSSSHQTNSTDMNRARNTRDKKNIAWSPSIRHGGCINTSCWLTCPWQLSSSKMSISSGEFAAVSVGFDQNPCPTQIITSGDDKLIKFWDVRNAMGIANPLPGGYDTFNPLAYYTKLPPSLCAGKTWKNFYRQCSSNRERSYHVEDEPLDEFDSEILPVVSGSVTELASIHSGHRGNVFHVTPVPERPGQVLSCGADGYLRLINLEKNESSVVAHPYVPGGEDSDDDNTHPFYVHAGMAFSHTLLTSNTGLLCSERGLHFFDVRVAPRRQQHQSLFQPHSMNKPGVRARFRSIACKACTIWSPLGMDTADPTFVFAGGADEVVDLMDLRMDGTSNNRRVVQRYKPRQLNDTGNVSVSGLDVTRNGKELLVSYEIDQIYTFPIFPNTRCEAGPTLEDIDSACDATSDNYGIYVPELASYGGHLNRYTFLKNPKYAGPNDEYICTGSDSGHAWIYDRKTGTVVSLLGADASTCNGIIPHPTLPYFITYGIESTAKLWRGSLPVDPTVDNSCLGRRKAYVCKTATSSNLLSPVSRSWDSVQSQLKRFDKEPAILPDYVASYEEIASYGHFTCRSNRGIAGGGCESSPRIGNAIRNLPMILRQNRYECYRSYHDEKTEGCPIEQPLVYLTHHVSMQRLKLQADSLGVPNSQWSPLTPWVFPIADDPYVQRADLVPDTPSDWILLDKDMTRHPIPARMNFNMTDYPEHFREEFHEEDSVNNTTPWLTEEQRSIDTFDFSLWPQIKREENDMEIDVVPDEFTKRSRKLLYETVCLLKEAGNTAMQENLFLKALRYYDKAIQYCAVVFMQYWEGSNTLPHLTKGHHATIGTKEEPTTTVVAVWSPLLRQLVSTRLNMAFLLLKSDFALPSRAAEQARHALKLLQPFTRQQGQVACMVQRKLHVITEDESKDTYLEAIGYQAKAYFRLGSAELDMADYGAAIKSFELSVKSSRMITTPGSSYKPDTLLVKRLNEAKRKHKNKKKRDRQRYQKLLAEDDEHESSDN